jgi:CDGSH-type Zn-finger protein
MADASYDIKTKAKVAAKQPIAVKVEKGKTYYWCVCGHSKNQPFCDGSHIAANDENDTEFQPIPWTAEEDGEKWFCQCKQTKNPPFCDGTHKTLQ